MQLSSAPQKILVPFANSGTKNTIPIASQIGITPGAASFTDGFPPLTLTPVASGGVPPYGADFNGVLNAITNQQMFQAGGGIYPFDSTWSTDNGGYPKGATILKSGGVGVWVSLIDNNTTNPDSAYSANWADADSLHYAVDTGAANAYVVTLPSAVPFLYDGLRVRFRIAHANTGASTIVVNGLSAATIYNAQHSTLIGSEFVVGGEAELVYNTTLTGFVVLECTGGAQQLGANSYGVTPSGGDNSTKVATTAFVQSAIPQSQFTVNASATAGQLLCGFTAAQVLFRNATLTSGTPVSVAVSTLSIAVPSGATLGMISGQAARLALLVAYNGGSPVYCICNGLNVDESSLISPTTISSGATSIGVIYSSSAVSANSPFRLVGYVDITETTAGTHTNQPTEVQGWGGFLAQPSSNQTWQSVSRSAATNYYNTTGKTIKLSVSVVCGSGGSTGFVLNGTSLPQFGSNANTGSVAFCGNLDVPPGSYYSLTIGSSTSIATWFEYR